MSEDAYFPSPPPSELFMGSRWSGKTQAMKQMMRIHAAKSPTGIVHVTRLDRETKEWVTDEITSDMPLDEIIM